MFSVHHTYIHQSVCSSHCCLPVIEIIKPLRQASVVRFYDECLVRSVLHWKATLSTYYYIKFCQSGSVVGNLLRQESQNVSVCGGVGGGMCAVGDMDQMYCFTSFLSRASVFQSNERNKGKFFFFWTKCNISWCGLRLRSSSGHPRWLNLFIRPERHHSLQCQLHFSPLNLSRLVLVLTSTTKAVDELVSWYYANSQREIINFIF